MNKYFTVAVCDTQKSDAGILAEIVDAWLARTENVQGHTVVFTDYSELRDSISSGLSIDICVLGIPTHGLSAVETARKLLRTDPQLPVIFAAAGKNYAFDAYELHVIRYILKHASSDELFSALDLAGLICVSAPAARLSVRTEDGVTLIPSDARSRTSFCISTFVPTSIPLVGSSSIRYFGSVSSHLASITFC